jgi:hypothetical protein
MTREAARKIVAPFYDALAQPQRLRPQPTVTRMKAPLEQ